MWTIQETKRTVQLCLIGNPLNGVETLWLREHESETPPSPWRVVDTREVTVRAISYIESLRAQDAATSIDASTGQAVISASRYMMELLRIATGLDAETIAQLPKHVGERLANMVTQLTDPNLSMPSERDSKSSSTTRPDSASASS